MNLIPLGHNSKKPLGGADWHDFITDVEEIHKKWLREGLNHGMPLRENELSALDFDGTKTRTGVEIARDFYKKHKELCTVANVSRRGIHLIFKGSTKTRKLLWDREIVGDIKGNGYLVIPPSVVNGFLYRRVLDGELQEFPEYLFPIEKKEVLSNHTIHETETIRRITRACAYASTIEPAVSGSGGHNKAMYFAGAMIQKFGLTIEQAWPIALSWNARCVPPWSEAELLRKLQQAQILKGQ